jgi:hypothetical protein
MNSQVPDPRDWDGIYFQASDLNKGFFFPESNDEIGPSL